MDFEFEIEGGNFSKAGTASSEVKKILKQLNVDSKIIKRTVVSLYEAEVNVVAHAYNGIMKVGITTEKIHVNIIDKGPGIPNIEMAMQEGYSTASKKVREMGFGAGMGLPNIKRNTDKLNIKSQVDIGTELEIINYFA
ncbi:MAG: ATP-binding protein [Marinifilaceae bacterium]|jgi:anti-sigma regulatory factor (Ser/Thr protein kinase)|nr:ATP-binding protein [Marinifilaceae bacterium]